MRPHDKTKLGFFPLPVVEADRLRNCLIFSGEFSALDPCVGDGVAFTELLKGTTAHRYGIEIDANRTEQARALGIKTVHAKTMAPARVRLDISRYCAATGNVGGEG